MAGRYSSTFSGDEPKLAAPGPASLAPPPPLPPQLSAPTEQPAVSAPEPMPYVAPAPAMAMALPAGPMMPDQSTDEPPLADKVQEWWRGLTGQQKGFTMAGARLSFFIYSARFSDGRLASESIRLYPFLPPLLCGRDRKSRGRKRSALYNDARAHPPSNPQDTIDRTVRVLSANLTAANAHRLDGKAGMR